MANQDFDKFADIPALQSQQSQILEIFSSIKIGLLELGNLGLKIDASKGLSELTKAQKDLDALENKLIATNEKLQASEQKVAQIRADASAKQEAAELRLEKLRADAEKAQEQRDAARLRRIKIEETEREKLASAASKTGGAGATDYTNSIPFTHNLNTDGSVIEPAVDIAALKGEKDLLTDVEKQAALTSSSLTAMGQSNLRAADRMTLADKQIVEGEAKVAAGAEASAVKTNAFGNMLTNVGQRISTFVVRDLLRAAAGFLVFTLAFEGIKLLFEFIVDVFSKVDEATARLDLFNKTMAEANKDAANELTDLKLLRQAAQDHNASMAERLAAVKRLKDEFPDYYKNLKDEKVLVGDDKEAYDKLTASIIANARAMAARVQIEDIERQKLDIDDQKRKIVNATTNETNRVKGPVLVTDRNESGEGVTQQMQNEDEQKQIIADRRIAALKEQDQKEAMLNDREDWLARQVGIQNLAKVVEKEEKDTTKTYKDELDKRTAARIQQEYELEKLILQQSIFEQKAVADSGGIISSIRIEARKRELAEETRLNVATRNNDLIQAEYKAKEERSRKGASGAEIAQIDLALANERDRIIKKSIDDQVALEAKAAVDIIAIRKEITDAIKKQADEDENIIKDQLAKELQDRQDYINQQYEQQTQRHAADTDNSKKALDEEFTLRLSKLKSDSDEYEKVQAEYDTRSQLLEFESNKKKLQIDIDHYQDQLRIMQGNGQNTVAQQKIIADAQLALAELVYNKEKSIADQKLKEINDLETAYNKLKTAVAAAFTSAVSGYYTKQNNDLQDQIDLVDTLKKKEIERVQASGDTQANQAARIAVIDAKANADKEALQRKQQQNTRNQAIFERSFKAFQIISDGIQTVAKLTHTLQILKAEATTNPALSVLIPFAAAQIPLAIATTGANLAALLAAPIPKYAKGTESAPGGPAIVGEAGRELAVDPSGKLTLYSSPTLAMLRKGTKVIPNLTTEQILKSNERERLGMLNLMMMKKEDGGNDQIVRELKELNKKSKIVIHNHAAIETTAWYYKQMKH